MFHRLLREVDPTFQEEMLKYGERTSNRRMLRLEGFADHTTKDTWDLSAWIRVYSVYLDERIEVFRVFHFDPEQVWTCPLPHPGKATNFTPSCGSCCGHMDGL